MTLSIISLYHIIKYYGSAGWSTGVTSMHGLGVKEDIHFVLRLGDVYVICGSEGLKME